jgi:N-acetylneuraminate synthase
MQAHERIDIAARRIGLDCPSYFVADIAANHDNDLERAKALIWMAKEAGADAAKFQHFKARTIVSDAGFKALGRPRGHQASWKRSVFEVFRSYEIADEWNAQLRHAADAAGIHFMTTPYDLDAIDTVDALVPAFKIGSGDITWPALIAHVASKGKPVLLATGASALDDVDRAVLTVLETNPRLVLMQCNTNYTGALENFRHINLNVLKLYARRYPGVLLGLSDHSTGHATVLGAIVLGARVIEKHFTDDNSRAGPDHGFSMNPVTWREMVDRSRELEAALGDGHKRVEDNERETAVLQQRCLRYARALPAGTRLTSADLQPLRPAPPGALRPFELPLAVGRRLRAPCEAGQAAKVSDLEA